MRKVILSFLLLFFCVPLTLTKAEEKKPVFQMIMKNTDGKESINAIADVGDCIDYEIRYQDYLTSDGYIDIYQTIPEHMVFVQASDGGLVTKKDGQNIICWRKQMVDDDGVVTASFRVKQGSEASSIQSHAELVTYNFFQEPVTSTTSNPVQLYVWAQPWMSILNTDGKGIERNIAYRDQTVTYWVHVQNVTDSMQHMVIECPYDHTVSASVLNISDDGVMKDSTVTWSINMEPKTDQNLSFQFYVPRLDNDLFVKTRAKVTYTGMDFANMKMSNTVNLTLGHQVGLDEDFTIRSGKEKTKINQNNERLRLEEEARMMEHYQAQNVSQVVPRVQRQSVSPYTGEVQEVKEVKQGTVNQTVSTKNKETQTEQVVNTATGKSLVIYTMVLGCAAVVLAFFIRNYRRACE